VICISAHGSATASKSSSGSKEACTPGLHARIHFDGFKGNWDEWFDQRDFERGELQSSARYMIGQCFCCLSQQTVEWGLCLTLAVIVQGA
jgi:hypothetical protein